MNWNFAAETPEAGWTSVSPDSNGVIRVQAPTRLPGSDNSEELLSIRAIDSDGNSSTIRVVEARIIAPETFWDVAGLYIIASSVLLVVAIMGVFGLAYNSGISWGLFLGLGPLCWFNVGLGYSGYRERWTEGLTNLERLLLLMVQPTDDNESLTQRLAALGMPVNAGQVEGGTANLLRQGFLEDQANSLIPSDPDLHIALQRQLGQTGLEQLANLVRAEHPLVALAQRFLQDAGFEVTAGETDPLCFFCQPVAPTWRQHFQGQVVYGQVIPDKALDQRGVTEVGELAQAAQEGEGQRLASIIFTFINQTPTDSGWIGIGGLRTEGLTVVPIDDTLMQQARVERDERQQLRQHLARFVGQQQDLYDVRDPVADRLNFFGREGRLTELLELFGQGRPVALFGLRKMGKSSLLQAVRERSDFAVAHADLQAGVELAGLYERIWDDWQRSLAVKLPEPQLPEIDGFRPMQGEPGEVSENFAVAARRLINALVDAGYLPALGLFVDEADLIVPDDEVAADAPELVRYLALARTLRGLQQETGSLALLVAGVDARLNWNNRWAGQQNPFYQFFRETYLGPLSETDCVQMVRNIGGQMGLAYEEEAAQRVAEIAGGHPFLARQLCSTALKERGAEESNLITLAQINAAATRFLNEPNTVSLLNERGIWGEVTDSNLWTPLQVQENEALIVTLAEKEQPEPELLDAAENRSARQTSLHGLEQRAVLGRLEALMRIQFAIFRDWVLRERGVSSGRKG